MQEIIGVRENYKLCDLSSDTVGDVALCVWKGRKKNMQETDDVEHETVQGGYLYT